MQGSGPGGEAELVELELELCHTGPRPASHCPHHQATDWRGNASLQRRWGGTGAAET